MFLAPWHLDQAVGGGVVEGGFFFCEELAGEDAVERGVLDVDVQRVARHGDGDVEVDLHVVADGFFDDELLRREPFGVDEDFPEKEREGREEDADGYEPAARRRGAVGFARFGEGIEGLEGGGCFGEVFGIETHGGGGRRGGMCGGGGGGWWWRARAVRWKGQSCAR